MIQDVMIREIATKVILRLAQRLGATGESGEILCVFTAATVGFSEALRQAHGLILDGFRLRLAFSPQAEHLMASMVKRQMEGFPHVSLLEPAMWLSALQEARAVAIPLLSLNTLSKISMLIADNTVTNIILHALFMGKPVVAARNGADPCDRGREVLGLHRENHSLKKAILQRLQTAEDYGCILTDASQLRQTLKSVLLGECPRDVKQRLNLSVPPAPVPGTPQRFITAAEVLFAWQTGAKLDVGSGSAITPLARELAGRYGVIIETDRKSSL
jgi:hypothetical protein